MQIEKQVNWLPANWVTGNVKVKNLEATKNAKGIDYTLYVESEGIEYKLSLWGQNLNNLIAKFGSDTDAWVGKQIFIIKESRPNEKTKIILSPI